MGIIDFQKSKKETGPFKNETATDLIYETHFTVRYCLFLPGLLPSRRKEQSRGC